MKNNTLPESFGTLSETINGLIALGYTLDFNIREECLFCQSTQTTLQPDDFHIDKVYRFEGASNPDDQSILYAIASEKHNVKGLLVNGYGISADEASSRLIEKLQTHIQNTSNSSAPDSEAVHRPTGNRTLSAPCIELDLPKSIAQLQQEPAWTNGDRNSISLYKSDLMRIVLMGLKKDAEIKPHKANGVISVQVIAGKIQFITEQQTVSLAQGQMIALEPSITHSLIAQEDSFVLLTMAMPS
jgi:quercetin dioxygenase-like cupin family protein